MSSTPPTRLRRRRAAERRFRLLGLAAVTLSAGFLMFLLGTMLWQGATGFTETRVALRIDLATLTHPRSSRTGIERSREPVSGDMAGPDLSIRRLDKLDGYSGRTDGQVADTDLQRVVATAATRILGRPDLLSDGAWLRVRDAIRTDPTLLSRTATFALPVASPFDLAAKGKGTSAAEAIVADLSARGLLSRDLDLHFFTGADATDPVRVGIWGALKGSLLTMAVTLALALPVGVLAALWLEEFAPRSRWTDLIEVSINNLAAVPSIIFGLLGLAVFLGTMGLPRSAPLVGGMTLALMTMPVIVIAARGAIRGVSPAVRDAALGIGASPVQVVFHHVLPLALPGILTGTIIGMARALGETAPLLLIGMRAFIAAPTAGLASPATVLPVQIFLWSDQVDRGFVEKTSAAIVVLLAVLLAMNGLAIVLRNRFEIRR